MPYKTVKQDCKRSDGRSGKYVLKVKPKPGKYKGRKRDSKGFVRIGCHTSKDAVTKQRAAIEAPPREGVNMKITAGQLRQIIKEELGSLNETVSQTKVENLDNAMRDIAYDMDDPSLAADFLREFVEGFIKDLEDMAASRPEGDRLGPAPDKGMDDALRKEIEQAVDTLANEEVFGDASAEDVAMQALDYVEHHPSLADEAYEIALAAAKKRGFPSEGR